MTTRSRPSGARSRRSLVAVCVCAAFATGCAGVPERVVATYADHGRVYRTTVDSSAARYVVEHGPAIARDVLATDARGAGDDGKADPRRDPAWDRFVAGLLDDPAIATDPRRLQSVARTVSVDFATALYRLQLEARPENRAFRERITRFETALDRRVTAPIDAGRGADAWTPAALSSDLIPPLLRARLVLVPGWRWQTSPDNGADLDRVRPVAERLGLACDRIDTDEDGTVEENAQSVARWLADAPGTEPIVLVSASKGGPEAALALDALRDSAAAERIVAWVNVSGLMGGSPIADGSLGWPARLLVQGLMLVTGGSMRPVPSMTRERSRERRSAITLPDHLVVLNYVAAPYSGDITPRGAFTWSFLRESGPNDGISLLADARMPGITLIEPGVDHFLAGPAVDDRLAALLLATLSVVGEQRAARAAIDPAALAPPGRPTP